MDLSLQIQQKQILSQRMQQSVEILQMNTLALSEYIREVAEENPLLDWSEERPLLPEDEKLLQKLEWLQESDEQNRGFYQTEMDNEKEREDLRYGKKEAQSLREYLHFPQKKLSETLSFNRQKILILNHLIPGFDGKRSFLWHTSGPILPNPLQRECPQTPNVSQFCLQMAPLTQMTFRRSKLSNEPKAWCCRK